MAVVWPVQAVHPMHQNLRPVPIRRKRSEAVHRNLIAAPPNPVPAANPTDRVTDRVANHPRLAVVVVAAAVAVRRVANRVPVRANVIDRDRAARRDAAIATARPAVRVDRAAQAVDAAAGADPGSDAAPRDRDHHRNERSKCYAVLYCIVFG